MISSPMPTAFVALKLAHRVDKIPYAEEVSCNFCYQQCSFESDFTDLFGANIGVLSRMVSDEEIYLTSLVKAL